MFNSVRFIEFPKEFTPELKQFDPAPIFRRELALTELPEKAVLSVCGLGLGCYYLNGRPISDNLLSTPVSDYNQTLWYHTYDLTNRLTVGKNIFTVILGNGFYNEALKTCWGNYTASWRDLPKLKFSLEMQFGNHTEYLNSDEGWLCSENSPVIYNQLRHGESYDARIGEEFLNQDLDTSNWVPARISLRQPVGVLRECPCQPIRVDKILSAQKIFKNGKSNWVIDFGQNISGYVTVKIQGNRGQELIIRHSERLYDDGTPDFSSMDSQPYYHEPGFQTDRLILSGNVDEYTPRFTYHGFRYIEIEGLTEKPTFENFKAVYIHQDIEHISSFKTSNEILNTLYNISIESVYSNMFYCLTDCPTREKFGWLNDSQSSCEHILQNFDSCLFFEKWLLDIIESQREDGEFSGIAPHHGWGFRWTGPVCSGIIFELPYRMHRIWNDKKPIEMAYSAMLKHFNYILTHKNEEGLIGYGLGDWAGPFLPHHTQNIPTPVNLSDSLLIIKFCRLMKYCAEIMGDAETVKYVEKCEKELTAAVLNKYVNPDGTCTVSEQTPISMLIVLGLYDNLEPLKQQLLNEVKKHEGHHNCGMLGLQFLYKALTVCGQPEAVFDILTAEGYPSFTDWLKDGATTMYELWTKKESNNHHMFTGFLAWYNAVLVGIQLDKGSNGYKKATISPWFIKQLDYCKGSMKTVSGEYKVHWQRKADCEVLLSVTVPEGAEARLCLNGYTCDRKFNVLTAGNYQILCKNKEVF